MAGYRQRLADRINAELNAKAMSVDDLAYKSGVSDKTIKRLLLANDECAERRGVKARVSQAARDGGARTDSTVRVRHVDPATMDW